VAQILSFVGNGCICCSNTINLFKNHNRMQVVGTGGGVKKGWKSEKCSGSWTINMLSSFGGGDYL